MVVIVYRIVWPNISQTMDPKVISMHNIFGQRGVCVSKRLLCAEHPCTIIHYSTNEMYALNIFRPDPMMKFILYVKLYIEDRVLQYEYFK